MLGLTRHFDCCRLGLKVKNNDKATYIQYSNVNSSKFHFPGKQNDATYNTGMKDSEFMCVSV